LIAHFDLPPLTFILSLPYLPFLLLAYIKFDEHQAMDVAQMVLVAGSGIGGGTELVGEFYLDLRANGLIIFGAG
jgi:hypothetical protein